MSVHYDPGKANVVADALSRLSMGSLAHAEEKRKELVKDIHWVAGLGVLLLSILDSGVTVHNGAESSLIVEVKEKQESDPILLELRNEVHNQRVEVFSQREMVYIATKVDCVFLMWGSLGSIFLRKLITPCILFIQIPLRCTAICGKSIG